MNKVKILEETLPFDEKIELKNWKHKSIDVKNYFDFHKKSLENYKKFWESVAKELEWFEEWKNVLEKDKVSYVYKWFKGGKINLSYLALDRHVNTYRKNKLALIWEGEPYEKNKPKEIRKFTYYEIFREVNRVAYILKNKFGLKKGDKIAIYLPMIPELLIFILAAARLGIIFTVIFSGFSAEALATRIKDLGASLLITTDGFYRRGKIINLKEIADKAVESLNIKNLIIVRRLNLNINKVKGRDYFLDELLNEVPLNIYIEPEKLESEHILYVLYTSGTTGKPKGIIHDNGGYSVILHATMKWVFDIKDEDIYWCTADIGWVTGHSYIAFGPLIEGATIIMYEGSLDYPNVERWWSIIERYGVTIFYTTPTAIRMLMKFGNDPVKKHDRSTLRLICSVGEPINPSAWKWLFEVVGEKRCPVASTWWMTETGGILISHLPGLMLVPLKPGTNGPPLPGIDADVVNEKGESLKHGEKGYLIIKNPWPGMPSYPTGIYKDPERYKNVYFDKFKDKGFFYTGDYAIKDKDGYIWVAGRADEVLKVAGHRLGTYEIESTLVSHKSVSEAAVIGIYDKIKGEIPVATVVLKEGFEQSNELRNELKKWVRNKLGPIAEPSQIYFVNKLPKTRSGKIMRRLIKAVIEGKSLGDVTTLEDEASVEEVKQAYESLKIKIK